MSLKQSTIGEIVSDNYHAAGVFREYGIDFCCGGDKLLSDVCESKGIPFEEVTNKLKSAPWVNRTSGDNYNDWSPDFLVDYIINTHHTFVRKKTDEVAGYAAKVAKVHGESHPENVEIFKKFISLSNELMEHLNEEESRVFPLIKKVYDKRKNGQQPDEIEVSELKAELDQMVDEHEVAGSLMGEIRSLSNGFTPPQDACATYRILYQNLAGFEEDLHKHVHLENNILFKKMERLIAA
ncbi:iron-sulfur cluster repair di-iron protein [Rhodohalobacter sp. 8-1]|uniref:iron-sulfur cluster repair di-iron protein n=1 Tax=Rhodohalobacter sp. 8-1 TaxID=3131972 RepID=UPI0030EE315C